MRLIEIMEDVHDWHRIPEDDKEAKVKEAKSIVIKLLAICKDFTGQKADEIIDLVIAELK